MINTSGQLSILEMVYGEEREDTAGRQSLRAHLTESRESHELTTEETASEFLVPANIESISMNHRARSV
jgi:hypothetical protein